MQINVTIRTEETEAGINPKELANEITCKITEKLKTLQMNSTLLTWGHILERMDTMFGIRDNDVEEFSLKEIEAYLESIYKEER